MSDIRILHNQIEIMWALRYLLECAKPDLVGRSGQLDAFRDDLSQACKDSNEAIRALKEQE